MSPLARSPWGPSRRPARALRFSILLALFAVTGCFEPPVAERLELRFLPNGPVIVAIRVEIADSEGTGSNPALKRRLAETRRALLDGTDAWSVRFAALEPAAERFSWEKRLGDVRQVERAAALAEPGDLGRFFADTGLAVNYRVEGEQAELTITPGTPGRASRRQRQQVERAMSGWASAVAAYLAAARDLYAYVEGRPERAETCFGALFREVLSEEARERLPQPSPEETRKVEALSAAMEEVWGVLQVEQGETHSLDELSHLVYDPLPAPLAVRLPSAAQEVEGFEAGPDGTLTAAGPGLWASLRALEGRWISPDPLLLFVAHGGQSNHQPFDLGAFLHRPRRAEPAPAAAEIRREIEARLELKPLYRAVWKIDPEAEEEFRW